MQDLEKLCQVIAAGKFAILDNNKNGTQRISHVFSKPDRFYTADSVDDIEQQLAAVEQQIQAGRYAVGYFSYELGYALNQRIRGCLPDENRTPLFCIGIYHERLQVSDDILDAALAKVAEQDDACIVDCRLNMTKDEYLDRLAKVKKHIYDGDTYQVNYTLKYKFRYGGSPLKLYAELRKRQRVEYGAFLDFPGLTILSRSPELFVNKRGEDIHTKPMKGTRKRGATPEEDRLNFEFLSSDEKSRAENVMIVDLLRNDLSRISHRGTVKTTGLFEVQTFETLHQMISTVSAKIDPDIPLPRLLQEIFPCGSITGAPKLRTMEIIRELESEPRGVYTGAIGYIGPDKSLCFNVPIRTLVLWPDGQGEMGVGSGIVHDSDPEAEYEECCLKGQFFTRGFSDFHLIECLLHDKGYKNFDRHMERLQRSAAELGFSLDIGQLRSDLMSQTVSPGVPTKVRVLLHKTGRHDIEYLPLAPANNEPRKIIVSPTAVSSKHKWLARHKTSCRTFYQKTYENYRRDGYYDVVFLNEHGEVTEGTFNNLFIRQGDRWYTPPVSCGLLPGIQRQSLLDSSDIDASEKVLTMRDLLAADEIFLTNAIRGVVRVELDASLMEETLCCA
ncbi:MAG TPA: aminodeoxychorismate synthase component I [Paucimonas sp.]|nr:aminodeoxychorismate synthase component I [Paucimonas sp.]